MTEKPICPRCGRVWLVMYRVRSDTFICRSCGTVWQVRDGNIVVLKEV